MKKFVKIFVMLSLLMSVLSCSRASRHEDRIVTDLNEIFDPDNETYTDWNYTEIDDDLKEAFGVYYDPDIHAYRQKYEYYAGENEVKYEKEKRSKPLNPITGHLIWLVLLVVSAKAYLIYSTWVQAKKLHRVAWMWIVNCIMGGLASFIVLALSRELEYDKDLDIRQERDLLGTTMFVMNLFGILVIAVGVSFYIAILRNPHAINEFLR